MSEHPPSQPPGWYHAQGDPPATQRYWDGSQWQGGPQPAATGAGAGSMSGAAGGSDLATPWARLAARLLDFLIWLVIFVVIGVLIGDGAAEMGTSASGRSFLAGVVATLVIMGYEVWFVANKGGTPGKLAVGLKVATADSRTVPVDLRTSVMRYLPNLVGIIPVVGAFISFIIGIVSVVLIFSDAQRQTVWDKLAGTVVIKQS